MSKAPKLSLLSRVRPSVFLVGAQKAGTTSLQALLVKHPDVLAPRTKELAFFHRDPEYSLGVEHYLRNFPIGRALRRRKVTLDATPAYLYYPECPLRIHNFEPEARIIIILRDPIERAFSAWNMYRSMIENDSPVLRKRLSRANVDTRHYWLPFLEAGRWISFTECIEQELDPVHADKVLPDCIRRGLYADQLDRYFDIFFPDQILLLRYSDFVADSCRVMQRVADFLKLRPFRWERLDYRHRNKGSYQSKLTASDRKPLETYFEASNARVFEKAGWDRF